MCISLHGLGKFFRFTGVQNFFSKISLLGDSSQNHSVSTQFHPPPFCWRKDFQKKGAWDMSNFPVGDSNNLAKFCLGEG